MRLVLSTLLAAASLAGCVTTYVLQAEPYNSGADGRIARLDYVVATLKTGQAFVMEPPRDYVTAWCGDNGCALKEAVASIARRKGKVDAAGTALVPLAIPACLVGLCGPMNGTAGRANPVPATPERISRLWLDYGYAEGNRIYYRSGEVNWCVGSRLFATQVFATDAQALDFVWNNRNHIYGDCLSDAGRIFIRKGERERGQKLWAIGEVRRIWDGALCAQGSSFLQIRVPEWLDIAPRRGDPSVLDLVGEAAVDPSTYYAERDMKLSCQMSASSSELERRRAHIMASTSAFMIGPIQY